MKQHKQKLSAEEKAILTAFESGQLHSVPKLSAEKRIGVKSGIRL